MPKQYGYIIMRNRKKIEKPLISGEELSDMLYSLDKDMWERETNDYFTQATSDVFLNQIADGEWHTIKVVRSEIPEKVTLSPDMNEHDYGGERVMIYVDHTEDNYLADDRRRAESELGRRILLDWERKENKVKG